MPVRSTSLRCDAGKKRKETVKRSLTVDDNASHVEEHARDLVRVFFWRSLTSQKFCKVSARVNIFEARVRTVEYLSWIWVRPSRGQWSDSLCIWRACHSKLWIQHVLAAKFD